MILVVAIVFTFATVNLILLNRVAGRVLAAEVEDRALTTARRLAGEVAGLILIEDVGALGRALDALSNADPAIGYALVVSTDGVVLASTFREGLPAGLLGANAPSKGREGSVLIADRGAEYRDVAVPVLRGEVGHVRLALSMDRVRSGLLRIHLALVAMVLVFLAVGLVGAHLTAHVIASPVERLAEMVRTFDPAAPDAPIDVGEPARGEIADLVASFRAMSARLRNLHEDRQEFQDRIVRAERLATVGVLAAGIAHEVNNPLAGLINCLQAISRDPEDVAQTRAYAQMMLEATRSIERTVRSLMDVAARSRPRPSEVDLRSLAERVEVLVRHRFAAAGVHLAVQAPAALPLLRTDEGLLQQVLVNLLINACDASPAGETVVLRVREVVGGVSFEVKDRGSGIAPEIRDRIFEPFVGTKMDRGGTGLGLAMVRRLVSEMDGTVGFESEPGRGTRFSVVLPRLAVDVARKPLET